MREYPLLVVGTIQDARHFKFILNDRFPEVLFVVTKYEDKFRVDPTDELTDIRYLQIYQYDQTVFDEHYKACGEEDE